MQLCPKRGSMERDLVIDMNNNNTAFSCQEVKIFWYFSSRIGLKHRNHDFSDCYR